MPAKTLGDTMLRAHVSQLPVPEFAETAWTPPPPLSEARVAVVTTAALHPEGGEALTPWATNYSILDASQRKLVLGHWSQNFDRSAFTIDPNVVYPLDRLDELAADGTIGSVAPRHFAFAGNQPDDVAKVRLDGGPACAAELKADGVDVVLLTPV
jgi:D-proline reductase (dithiol) PrdB